MSVSGAAAPYCVICYAITIALFSAVAAPAQKDYRERLIRIVVPAPGGPSDIGAPHESQDKNNDVRTIR